MEALIRVSSLFGLADSVWQAVDPWGRARFWGRWLAASGRGTVRPRVEAAVQFALCLYLLRRPAGRHGGSA